MPLKVGRWALGPTFGKCAKRRGRHGHGPGAQKSILQGHADSSQRIAIQGIDRGAVGDLINRADL